MAKKGIKGKRMKVFLTDGYDKVELPGVQGFGYKTNVSREGHSEYGSDGDVLTITTFENVTGALDVLDHDEVALAQARSMMTGNRAASSIGIDFSTTQGLWVWKNNYDPGDPAKTTILSSDLIREAHFDEDYKSELNSVHTRAFSFQGLRGINFPDHAIHFNTWQGDAMSFTFSHPAVQYAHEAGLVNNASASGYVLALFINGVWSNDKIASAQTSSVAILSSVALTASDTVVALTLYDGTA